MVQILLAIRAIFPDFIIEVNVNFGSYLQRKTCDKKNKPLFKESLDFEQILI